MPEGPEVEGFKKVVEDHVVGRTIERARFLDDWMLKNSAPSTAARRFNKRTVTAVDRRGKMLALFTEPLAGKTDSPILALHFGMTGRPVVSTSAIRCIIGTASCSISIRASSSGIATVAASAT